MQRHTMRQNWFERLYNLRRDRRGTYERPHKPVLLLAIIDLLDRGILTGNEVRLTPELIETFRRYFAVVRQGNDQPTIENPFYHLCGDGFWELVSTADERPLYVPGNVSRPPTRSALSRVYGRFDREFFDAFLGDAYSRGSMRDSLLARYFPSQREELAAIAGTVHQPNVAESRPKYLPERTGAFRRVILELYDYRCAACGVRVKLPDDRCLVEAAHIIPFEVSQNDKPDNGLALCPNHHWAMDRFLIAPCPDPRSKAGIWRVGHSLDSRIDGQKDIVALAGRPVIPPSETKFCPAPESLRWREQRLDAAG